MYPKMSDITRLPYNTTILDRLFSQMPSGFSSDPVEEDAIVFSATYENRLKSGTIKKIIQYLPNTEKAYQAEVEMPSVATVFGSITGNTFTVSNENSVNLSVDQYVKQLTYDPLTIVPFKILSINTATVAGFSSYTINATISASSQYFSVYDNFLIGGTISGYLNTYKTNIIGTLSQVSGPSLFITFADLLPFGISKQNENSMYASLTSIGISGLQYELQLDISKISLHIADAELTISSDNEYIVSESIDLENYTIQSLVNFFEDRYKNKDSKIILRLADNASSDILDLSATVLCEGSASLKNGSVTWTRFNNQNYSLITAFALIVKIYKKLISGALAQTDQRLATRDWLEYWGSLLGISRESYEQFDEKTSEPDTAYRERMRRETMFPKSNNVAMAYLLSQATSRNVTVSDGGQPFVLYSPLNPIVNTLPIVGTTAPSSLEYFLGPSTGGGSFSVNIPLLPAESDVSQTLVSFVSRLINKYKPAGIPFTIN